MLKFSTQIAAAKQQGNAQGCLQSDHCLKINTPEPLSALPLGRQQWPSAWRKGSTHGKQCTQASGNTLSFTLPTACGSTSDSSAPGRATGKHSERLLSCQAACSSHHTYLLLQAVASGPRPNAAGRTPAAGKPSTILIRRNYSSPGLVSSLHPTVLGIVKLLTNLRTEGCLLCQRQFSVSLERNQLIYKQNFTRSTCQTKNYQLEACTVQIWP